MLVPSGDTAAESGRVRGEVHNILNLVCSHAAVLAPHCVCAWFQLCGAMSKQEESSAGAAGGDGASGKRQDFSGTWVLETTDNLDAFMAVRHPRTRDPTHMARVTDTRVGLARVCVVGWWRYYTEAWYGVPEAKGGAGFDADASDHSGALWRGLQVLAAPCIPCTAGSHVGLRPVFGLWGRREPCVSVA